MADLNGSLSFEDIAKWKVADLKKELKARGLSQVGNKNELFERLQLAYDEQDMGQGSPLDNEELLDDDEVLEEDESLDEDLAESESAVKPAPPALKRKATPPSAAVLPMKKIVLNRTTVATAEKENLDCSEEGQKLDVADPAKRDVVKISAIPVSAKERLEMRASKFGVSLSPDSKKEVRAARFGITTTAASASTTTAPANIDALKRRAERFGASVSSTLTKVELDEKLKKRQERFGLPEAAAPAAAATKAKTATTYVRSTSSSSSVKVPITFAGAAAPAPNKPADDVKQKRAERFKATL